MQLYLARDGSPAERTNVGPIVGKEATSRAKLFSFRKILLTRPLTGHHPPRGSS